MIRAVPVRPSRRPTYNAGSAVRVPYLARTADLELETLASARYRIDDLTNSLVVQDWTAITPPVAARGEITVPATLNGMNREYNDRELRQVTFEFTDSAGNVRQELEHYWLAAVFQGAA